MFVFAWSDRLRFDNQDKQVMDTRQSAEAPTLNSPVWQLSLPPHSVKKIADAEFRAVQVELKDAPYRFV